MQSDFNKINFFLSNDLIIPEHRKEILKQKNETSKKYLESCENFTELCGFIVDELELPIELQWTNEDVLIWIKNLGFPQYQNTFKINLINGRTLLKIEASSLVKMNIKDFDHIQLITSEIRKMYQIELEKFSRSISFPSKHPETLYKFFKISTGPTYELCPRTDFLKKIKLMGEANVQLNHFEALHEWLKHTPDFQNVRIGKIKRIKLFFVKPNPHRELQKFDDPAKCRCTMPPCECSWSEKQKRQPWRLNFLVQFEQKYSVMFNVETKEN